MCSRLLSAPGGAATSDVPRDRVIGRATHLGADPPFPPITVGIVAVSDADGSHPRGLLTVRSAEIGQRRLGRVTCLDVQGDTATIGVRIVLAEDPAAVGKGELFKIIDGGASGDEIAGYAVTEEPPTVCPPLPFSVGVISGDYRIVDATP